MHIFFPVFSPCFSLFVSLLLVSPPPSVSVFHLFYCHSVLLFSSLSPFSFVCLSHYKCTLMCPCTITKPACLFMLHRGITLFSRYYFFVKSPWYDLPQTALHCPTLIIFSHSANLGHNDTHAHTFSSQNCFCVCVFVLSQHWFLGVLKWKAVYFILFPWWYLYSSSHLFTRVLQMIQYAYCCCQWVPSPY